MIDRYIEDISWIVFCDKTKIELQWRWEGYT